MNITIVLTLIGIILGAISLGYGGWLAGGVIGYLAGQLKNLSDRHKQLEREVAQLKQSSTPATSVRLQQRKKRLLNPTQQWYRTPHRLCLRRHKRILHRKLWPLWLKLGSKHTRQNQIRSIKWRTRFAGFLPKAMSLCALVWWSCFSG